MSDELKEAEGLALRADEIAHQLLDIAHACWARVIRLRLLQAADEHPGIVAFHYEVEYEYDDQAAFFPTTRVTASWVDDAPEEDIDGVDDELGDESFGRHALADLFGVANADHGGTITVAQLRARPVA